MSQIEQLKQMLDGMSSQVKTLESLSNLAQKNIDKEHSQKLQPISNELIKAIHSAKDGNSEGLNKFIKAHANTNK
tara:strand:+ start:1857 stop:2081 length:225 start_codon:yes stop_codon:yes gene_type:complete